MKQDKPLVSVVIPTYNGSSSIKRAIESVLNQDYPNIELIVVDDASIDNTSEIVKSFNEEKIQLIRYSEHKNGSVARNIGIKASKGSYVAFLDDDDEWLEEKISTQIKYLETKDQLLWKGCVCSYVSVSSNSLKNITVPQEGDITKEILLMEFSIAAGSTLLVQREVFDHIGLFDEKYIRHQDLELVIRFLRKYKLAVVNKSLIRTYGHSGTVSGDKLVLVKELFLKDFRKDIEKFGKDIARKIYARQWLQVSKHYAIDGDIKNTFKYLFKSLSCKLLFSKRIKVLILENYIILPYYLLKGILTKNKKKGR
ncbi:MAG: glycosyltransferase family 2 protein [Candidatus Dojkabacteria bacterium]